jgi:hypothetical protein
MILRDVISELECGMSDLVVAFLSSRCWLGLAWDRVVPAYIWVGTMNRSRVGEGFTFAASAARSTGPPCEDSDWVH